MDMETKKWQNSTPAPIKAAEFYAGAEAARYAYKPTNTLQYGKAVVRTRGQVENAEGLLQWEKAPVVLRSDSGMKPYIVLDMGEGSCGGYAAFRVERVFGPITLRVAYACWFDYIVDETYGAQGDYGRGTCQYLGVELPVLPANPYRYELYTVTEPGEYFFPLLQGQVRFVRLQLDTPDAAVALDWFRMENIRCFDSSPHTGYFLCSDEDINRVWYASAWTAQLASIPSGDAWIRRGDWLLPRYIECGQLLGIWRAGTEWRDYGFSCVVRISRNPDHISSACLAVRCRDAQNGTLFRVGLDGGWRLLRLRSGQTAVLAQGQLPELPMDNRDYVVELSCCAKRLTVCWNGRVVYDGTPAMEPQGTVGLYAEKEQWFSVRQPQVNGISVADPEGWDYTRTLGYLSDGGMRDRLLWTGDIVFASRNIYYASSPQYLRSSIAMMLENQTPEGYVHPCPYPGNHTLPGSGDYGPFPSAEFSAWFTPIVAEYLLFTGDADTAHRAYGAVQKNLASLLADIDTADGLFQVRPELSKRAMCLELSKGGKITYTNLVVYMALEGGVFLAKVLGKSSDVRQYRLQAQALRRALRRELFVDELHSFVLQKGSTEPCVVSNAVACLLGVLNEAEARQTPLDNQEMGKLMLLGIRAMLRCGQDDRAIARFRAGGIGTNWVEAMRDWRHPRTISECMHYPPGAACGNNWNDKSHPDAAAGDVFSRYLLGVWPCGIGYEAYEVRPHLLDVQWARGSVPTPRGEIGFAWQLREMAGRVEWTASLRSCADTVGTLWIPLTGSDMTLYWNGREIRAEELAQFSVTKTADALVVRHIPAGEQYFRTESDGALYRRYRASFDRKTDAAAAEPLLPVRVTADVSVEDGGYSVHNLEKQDDSEYSSGAVAAADRSVTLRLDMGKCVTARALRLLPGSVPLPSELRYTVDVLTLQGERRRVADVRSGKVPGTDGMTITFLSPIGLPSGRYIELHIAWNTANEPHGICLSGIEAKE